MSLLWLELNKLASYLLRLILAGVFILAVLNLSLGGTARLVERSGIEGNETKGPALLHMQIFGLFHVHEQLNTSSPGAHHHNQATKPEIQQVALSNSGEAYVKLDNSDSDYSFSQKAFTGNQNPHEEFGLYLTLLISRRFPSDSPLLPDPFLSGPEEPPR